MVWKPDIRYNDWKYSHHHASWITCAQISRWTSKVRWQLFDSVNPNPRYRFTYPQPGINALLLAAVMKGPAVTIPSKFAPHAQFCTANAPIVAEIPFYSRVTNREEKLPFAVAVMGNPGKLSCRRAHGEEWPRINTSLGTDLALMDTLLGILAAVNLPPKVECGNRIFQ